MQLGRMSCWHGRADCGWIFTAFHPKYPLNTRIHTHTNTNTHIHTHTHTHTQKHTHVQKHWNTYTATQTWTYIHTETLKFIQWYPKGTFAPKVKPFYFFLVYSQQELRRDWEKKSAMYSNKSVRYVNINRSINANALHNTKELYKMSSFSLFILNLHINQSHNVSKTLRSWTNIHT